MGKTAAGLVAFALARKGHHYMYGNNGNVITESLIQFKADQYPEHYPSTRITELRAHIGEVGDDCSTAADLYTGNDRSADGHLNTAQKSGSLSTMPEIPGITLHMPGHMAVYLGNGLAIEARAGDVREVVITDVAGRGWTAWAMLAGIDYSQEDTDMIYCKKDDQETPAVLTVQAGLIKLGIEMKNPLTGKIFSEPGGFYGLATASGVAVFKQRYSIAGDGTVFDGDCVTAMFKALAALPDQTPISQAQLDAVITNIARAKTLAAEIVAI